MTKRQKRHDKKTGRKKKANKAKPGRNKTGAKLGRGLGKKPSKKQLENLIEKQILKDLQKEFEKDLKTKETKRAQRLRSKNNRRTKGTKRVRSYSLKIKKIKDNDLKRGDYKVIEIALPWKSFEDKAQAILQMDTKELKFLHNRDVQPDGSIMYPRNAMFSIRVVKPDKTVFWESKYPPTSFVTSPANVKKFGANYLREYNSDFQEVIAEGMTTSSQLLNSPYDVDRMSIRFLYVQL